MPRRQRTRRTDQDIFTRPSPTAVTYDLSVPDQAMIRVPPGSTWTSGPHWHTAHTEFLQVLSGRAHVTLAGRDLYVDTDTIITAPRGTVHEWRRTEAEGPELVVREWTEPRDGAKEVVFRNLNGIILDEMEGASRGMWGEVMLTLELWNLFWRADKYPVVLSGGGWLGRVVTRGLVGVAVMLGWVVGRPGVYKEYGEVEGSR